MAWDLWTCLGLTYRPPKGYYSVTNYFGNSLEYKEVTSCYTHQDYLILKAHRHPKRQCSLSDYVRWQVASCVSWCLATDHGRICYSSFTMKCYSHSDSDSTGPYYYLIHGGLCFAVEFSTRLYLSF